VQLFVSDRWLNDYQCWVVLTNKVGLQASYKDDSLNENWPSKNYPRYHKDPILISRVVMWWTIGFRCPFSRVVFVQLSISHGSYMITSVGLFSPTWSILKLTSRLGLSMKVPQFLTLTDFWVDNP